MSTMRRDPSRRAVSYPPASNSPANRPASSLSLLIRSTTVCSASITVLPVTRIFPGSTPSPSRFRRESSVGAKWYEAIRPVIWRFISSGHGAVYVVRAQSRLDVSDRNAAVKGGQCGGRRGRRVAVNQHHVRTGLVEHVAHARQHAGSHVVEILSLPHNVQIVVGLDSEQPQHLIEHLAVLSADADDRPERVRMPSELPYQRGHFDRLGTSPEKPASPFSLDKVYFLNIPQKSSITASSRYASERKGA